MASNLKLFYRDFLALFDAAGHQWKIIALIEATKTSIKNCINFRERVHFED